MKTRVFGVLVALVALVGVTAGWVGNAEGILLAATTTTTDLNNAMKILFEDSIVNDVVTDTEFLDIIETDDQIQEEETTGGRFIETAQYFGLPAGVGARHDNEYIPVPGGPNIQNSRIFLKKVQGVVEMTGDTMRKVRTNEGAFLNWADRALPDLVERLRNELDRMSIGYGAGIKARVNDGSPDATLGIDSAFGIAGLSDGFLSFLEEESIVFSANATGDPLRNAGGTHSSKIIDISDTTLTLDALPPGVADNDYIFLGDEAGFGGQGSSGSDREFTGVLGLVDDGSVLATFQNIIRANFRLWRSIVVNGAVAPFNGVLTEDLLTFADDETSIRGGGKVNAIITNRKANRGYWQDLRKDRTLADPRSFMGGKAGTSITLGDRELALKVSRKMPRELTFGIQTSTWKKWMLGTFEWDDITGSIWNRVTDSIGRKDAFYAVGNMYLQLGNLAPRKNFKIENLAS